MASTRPSLVGHSLKALLHRAQAAADFTWKRDPARSRSVAVATYSRLDEGAKVWIEGATLVGLENTGRAGPGWVGLIRPVP